MQTGRASLASVRQLVARLSEQIHLGVWPPGTRLPPERALARELAVHRSTVASAYDELRSLGLVDRRQGSGTFVHGDLWGVTPDWGRYLEAAAFRPTQPLLRQARSARERTGLIDFTQADLGPDLWPGDLLVASLGEIDASRTLGYAPAAGLSELREAVSRHLSAAHGTTFPPDTILVTAGAQQALYLLARALLRPGDAIAIEQPSFYYSLSLFQSAGVRLLPIPMDGDGVLPDALEGIVRAHRPAMVWLNPTYHNPTGTTLSLERRRAVLDICLRWNLPIVEDDAFGLLTVAGAQPPPPPLKALDSGHRVVYVGTLSKIAAPGLRIGWIAAPEPLVERLSDVKGQIDLGVPGIVQEAAAHFLCHPRWSAHVRAVQAELRRRRDRFLAALCASLAGRAQWSRPDGGLYVWLRWADALTDRARLEWAIRQGVSYTPGRIYGAGDGFARLNYVAPDPDLAAEGVARLAVVPSALRTGP